VASWMSWRNCGLEIGRAWLPIEPAPQAFLGVSALLFAASAAATIVFGKFALRSEHYDPVSAHHSQVRQGKIACPYPQIGPGGIDN